MGWRGGLPAELVASAVGEAWHALFDQALQLWQHPTHRMRSFPFLSRGCDRSVPFIVELLGSLFEEEAYRRSPSPWLGWQNSTHGAHLPKIKTSHSARIFPAMQNLAPTTQVRPLGRRLMYHQEGQWAKSKAVWCGLALSSSFQRSWGRHRAFYRPRLSRARGIAHARPYWGRLSHTDGSSGATRGTTVPAAASNRPACCRPPRASQKLQPHTRLKLGPVTHGCSRRGSHLCMWTRDAVSTSRLMLSFFPIPPRARASSTRTYCLTHHQRGQATHTGRSD